MKSRKERFISDGVGGAQPNISSGYLKKVEMDELTLPDYEVLFKRLNKDVELIPLDIN